MAGSLTQSATVQNNTAVSLTGVASGACLVLKVGTWNDTATAVSGGGATWTERADTGSGLGARAAIWVGYNSTGGSVTVTATMAFGSTPALILEEWAGLGTTDPFDVAATATGLSTSPDSGTTVTLAQADSVKLSACSTDAGSGVSHDPRAGDGDTEVPGQEDGGTGPVIVGSYKILAATTGVAGRWTLGSSLSWDAAVVVLKASAAAATSLPPISTPTRATRALLRR